jgi:hypothetical protein
MQSVEIFRLAMTDEQKLVLPEVASILGTELLADFSGIDLYVFGDQSGPTIEVTFYVIDTGQQVPDTFAGRHIKTLPKGDGHAYHVFMKPPGKRKPIVAERNPNDPAADTDKRGNGNGP